MIPLLLWVLGCGGPTAPADWTAAATARDADVTVDGLLDPDPPRQRGNVAWLRIRRGGAPVTAGVTVDAMMPEMGAMPEMRSVAAVDHVGDGVWRAAFDLEMGGGWTLRVSADGSTAQLPFTVGVPGLVGEAAAAPVVELDLPDQPLPDDALSAVQAALSVSALVASRLADDRLDGLADAAAAVAPLTAAAPSAGDLSPWLLDAAAAADRLATATDLVAARRALGALNRALLAAASADPRSRDGRYVFSCPMTGADFGKWVQSGPDLANPYMGRSMPGCGEASTWTTTGPAPAAAGSFVIDASRRAQFGVATVAAAVVDLTLDVRALGRVTVDEGARVDASVNVDGVIRRLHVAETGAAVRQGSPLVTLYSPTLLVAAQDLLLASARGPDDPLAKAARRRLDLLGAPGPQVEAALRAGEAPAEWTLPASASGVVLERLVSEGQAITAGQPLLTLAPLGTLWVDAAIYPADQPFVAAGQAARVSSPGGPEREARVDRLLPSVRPEDQVRTARLIVDGAEWVPGQLVDVRLIRALPGVLAVPASAVLYVGPRRVVFVDLGEGRLAARVVTVGARAGDLVEVTSGLRAGEAVVASGTFLVAAESRLRDAFPTDGGDDAAR
jgi:Cu(I)/Ag(I) efflux system membrane fusion protein